MTPNSTRSSSMSDTTATAVLPSKAPSEKPFRPSSPPTTNVPPGKTSLDKDPEAQPEEHEDKYLHGLKLVLVFVGLSLALFVIILDQTVSPYRSFHS